MSWVALAVGVGTAAYGAYNQYSQKKDAEENAEEIFGRRPTVAPYIPTDLSVEQGKAAASNLANADQIEAFLNRITPGWSEMLKAGSANTLDLLHGNIPQDVQDQIYRSSAFKSLSGGFQGSPMSRALTARDFGKTSLDLQQQGANAAQQWSSIAQGAFKPYAITTEDQVGAAFANAAGQQATAQHAANVAAAPNPAAAGLFNVNTAGNASTNQTLALLNSAAQTYSQSQSSGGYDQGYIAGAYGTGGSWQYDPYTGEYKQLKSGSA